VFGECRELLVLCDCYEPATRAPLKTNARARAARIFEHPDVACEEPWFGIEQEYTLLDSTTGWPIGWPVGGVPAPQGPYYCGVGKMYGREIAEAHFRACHYAGLDVGGLNAEVRLDSW
jgi:glutamine synthetase